MTPQKAEYLERKNRVLGIVVNEFIKTVSPVSSAYISQEYMQDLSPATIRNILAELEHEGLLTHPHTSAGRTPTEEGYRFYVDYLMQEIQLLNEEKARIKNEYEKGIRDLEIILDKTSRVLSDLTHYTSIVVVDGWHGRIFCRGTGYVVEYPNSHNTDEIREILRILEEKERILEILNRTIEHKIQIYIGHELACEKVESCSLAVSGFRTHNGPSGRIAVLGPTRMDYQRVVSTLDYVSHVIEEVLS